MQRIASRDRPYEREMDRDYIDLINRTYDEFFGEQHQGAKVLVIDTNELDLVRKPNHLKLVENRLRQTLRLTPFQPELPFGND
ncbi:MAG: deoxynucleoside kinase, partial [Anaerolineales bacterium]